MQFFRFLQSKHPSEDIRRRENILNILLFATIALFSIAISGDIVGIIVFGSDFATHNTMPLSYLLPAFGTLVLLFILSKKGYSLIASYVFSGLLFILSIYLLSTWGGDVPVGLLFTILTIVISGIVINSKTGLITAILAACSVVTITVLHTTGMIPISDYWRQETLEPFEAGVIGAMLLIVAVVTWLSNKEIDKSLKRARKSEAELKEERDLLEIRMKERTDELHRVELEKMSDILRFAEFGKLSSGIFHDLFNPLTAIVLNIENMKKSNMDIRPFEHDLEKAMKAAHRMQDLISATKKHIASQDTEEQFNPRMEIEDTINILQYHAHKKRVRVSFDSKQHTCVIVGNPAKFNQIVSNITINAIEAFPETEHEEERREIRIELICESNKIILVISDTGPGIHEDIRKRIFDPFFSTKSNKEGSGIGLSIVKNIVEQDFNGTISVKSNSGSGTTFIIILYVTPVI